MHKYRIHYSFGSNSGITDVEAFSRREAIQEFHEDNPGYIIIKVEDLN